MRFLKYNSYNVVLLERNLEAGSALLSGVLVIFADEFRLLPQHVDSRVRAM